MAMDVIEIKLSPNANTPTSMLLEYGAPFEVPFNSKIKLYSPSGMPVIRVSVNDKSVIAESGAK